MRAEAVDFKKFEVEAEMLYVEAEAVIKYSLFHITARISTKRLTVLWQLCHSSINIYDNLLFSANQS